MLGFDAINAIAVDQTLEANSGSGYDWFTFIELTAGKKPSFKEMSWPSWKTRKREVVAPEKPKKRRIRGSGKVHFDIESLKHLPEDVEIRIFVEDNSCSNDDGHYEVYSRDGSMHTERY